MICPKHTCDYLSSLPCLHSPLSAISPPMTYLHPNLCLKVCLWGDTNSGSHEKITGKRTAYLKVRELRFSKNRKVREVDREGADRWHEVVFRQVLDGSTGSTRDQDSGGEALKWSHKQGRGMTLPFKFFSAGPSVHQ